MEEVLELSDRITVLRDGRNAGELARAEATTDKIVALMVGRELSGALLPGDAPIRRPPDGRPCSRSRTCWSRARRPASASTCGAGEILGFAGLVGAGRTELAQTIFGVTPARGGNDDAGRPSRSRRGDPRDAIDRGVYLAPEDRKRHGLVLPMSVAENTSLPDVGHYNRWGWLDRRDRAARRRRPRSRGCATKTPSLADAVRDAVGRQPAESRAGQVARHAARGC